MDIQPSGSTGGPILGTPLPPANAPALLRVESLPPVSAAVHGPYEDLAIEGLKTVQMIIQDAPPDVKQKVWGDWLAWHSALQTFASKLDFLHLFHTTGS